MAKFKAKIIQVDDLSSDVRNYKLDILDCEGPFGNFVFEDPEGRDVLFIAGGTGIAPIRSMLNYAINNNIGKIITLFFSFGGHKQFLYSDEFEEILEKNSKRFRLVVSNTDN